jgi:hypothetical protein
VLPGKLKAYLALYCEFWNSLLADHRHEVGEDTSECKNCILEKMTAAMTRFERFCWNWYQSTVTEFSLKAGIVSDFFRSAVMSESTRELFIKALSAIDNAESYVAAERMKLAAAQARGEC